MKLFHTADWHIGKVFLNKNFIDEQREVLEQFIKEVERENPEVILIAGDIYDKSIPTLEAIELLNATLKRLVVDMKKQVLLISGNHDSADRLAFGAEILRSEGLYIVTDISRFEEPITVRDEYGEIDLYAIPYLTPMKARLVLGDESIKTYDDIARLVTSRIGDARDRSRRSICIYHGFIVSMGESLVKSDSERPLSIGGTDAIDVSHFEDFDYLALGHLHGPQKVKSESARYSGSLLKYSFSEQNQKKGVTVVELGPDGEVEVELKEIYPRRNMRVIEGSLEEIREMRKKDTRADDYIMIRLLEDGELHRPKEVLDTLYPNILRIEIARDKSRDSSPNLDSLEGIGSRSVMDMFASFYGEVTNNEISENRLEKLKELIEHMDEEDRR